MNNLYYELSYVYDKMYETFMEYDKEYDFYSKILKIKDVNSIVEIGCGSGNLAQYFIKDNYKYLGIDLSEEMLKIARTKEFKGDYLQADMRSFYLPEKKDCALMTGRTSSYLITNNDVLNCFKSTNLNLNDGGIFVFDAIDANFFIPKIDKTSSVIHEAYVDGQLYRRKSRWEVNVKENWCFDWHSIYCKVEDNGEELKIGEDNSTIRTFTKNDIEIFLHLAGFKVESMEYKPSYAFDTFVVVARKG